MQRVWLQQVASLVRLALSLRVPGRAPQPRLPAWFAQRALATTRF
ncbi:MAG TPA: hypothetical protein VGI32_12790 [Steroidobacteraceae bacterium]